MGANKSLIIIINLEEKLSKTDLYQIGLDIEPEIK